MVEIKCWDTQQKPTVVRAVGAIPISMAITMTVPEPISISMAIQMAMPILMASIMIATDQNRLILTQMATVTTIYPLLWTRQQPI